MKPSELIRRIEQLEWICTGYEEVNNRLRARIAVLESFIIRQMDAPPGIVKIQETVVLNSAGAQDYLATEHNIKASRGTVLAWMKGQRIESYQRHSRAHFLTTPRDIDLAVEAKRVPAR